MVLTVDIGNSNIVVGVWDDSSLKFTGRIKTRREYSEKELEASLTEMLKGFDGLSVCEMKGACEGAILSSVVPEITDKTLCALENITGKRPLLMGPFLHTGVDISDYAEGAIGMDRIVDMSAALAMYGAPVMVADLGTCTTITVAGYPDKDDASGKNSKETEKLAPKALGKLIGGMICPGVQLSLDAEAQRASQLPQLSAGNVETLLGKDTSSNMMAGAVAGTGLMLSELADRIMDGDMSLDKSLEKSAKVSHDRESGKYPDLKVVITGGLSEYVRPWMKCRAEVFYEKDLLLRGLYEIFVCNRR